MSAVLLWLKGVPLLVWPLVIVTGLWLASKHEVVELKNAAVVKQAQADRSVADANAKANASASKYELAVSAQKVKTIYVTRKVHDAIASEPAWAGISLPDSVRAAVAAANSSADPGQPDKSVRSAGSAADDERRTAGGLRPSAGFLGRLFSKAPSAGASAAALMADP